MAHHSDLKSEYDRQGYLLLRYLFTTHEVQTIKQHFDKMWEEGVPGYLESDSQGNKNWLNERYPRIVHPHRFDPLSKSMLLDGRITDLIATLLDDEPLAAQTMYYWKPPGTQGQALHQDNLYLQADDADGCMAAWIAIDEANETNGCLSVVPGSHRCDLVCPEKIVDSRYYFSDYVAPPQGFEVVPVIMHPGDALFFGGKTIHGSGPNDSDTESRRSFICHYIGARSTKSAGFYNPLLRVNGDEIFNHESDGGPCGVHVSAPH